ncbi:MAG: hypothetical protein AAGD25_06940 [Cyanobacteria bacterium P01_F01_bin.150]
MAITNYSDVQSGDLIVGQVYSDEANTVIRSGFNSEASTILPAGFAYCRAAASVGEESRLGIPLILPVDANSVFTGIGFIPRGLEKRDGYSLDADDRFGYPVDYEVSYVVKGIIAVEVDDTVAYGDPVFWRHTATGDERAGMFRMDADTSDAVQIGGVDTCKFVSDVAGTAAAPAIALVSINIA